MGVPCPWCRIQEYEAALYTDLLIKDCLFVHDLLVTRARQSSCPMERRELRPRDDLRVNYRALHLTGEQTPAPTSATARISMHGDNSSGSQDSSEADDTQVIANMAAPPEDLGAWAQARHLTADTVRTLEENGCDNVAIVTAMETSDMAELKLNSAECCCARFKRQGDPPPARRQAIHSPLPNPPTQGPPATPRGMTPPSPPPNPWRTLSLVGHRRPSCETRSRWTIRKFICIWLLVRVMHITMTLLILCRGMSLRTRTASLPVQMG